MRFRKYIVFYLLAAVLAFGMKYYCREADSDGLIWLLAPIAWWVRGISGITFSYEPGVGYVSHALRFILAPSCAGSQFLIICMVTLTVSFVHRMETWKKGFIWTGFSMAASYLYTILINGIRILLSIRIPQMLEETSFYGKWISPEKLHTLIGTSVYFVSLLAVFFLADVFSGRMADEGNIHPVRIYIQPVFWYAFFVIVIPFLNRMYRNNYEGFAEYARLIISVCLIVTGTVWIGMLQKLCLRRKAR